jgi:deoxyribodipyrimidine photo-lyase
MKSLYIFRRDFRIKDNTAFNEMLKNSTDIYPIFIFTPTQITHNNYRSSNSIQFMIESLIELNNSIKITFCYGNVEMVIEDIVKKNNINSIYCNTDYTPYAIHREETIEKLAKKLNITFNYFHDITLFEPNTIFNKSNKIYQKFTPFYNSIKNKKFKNITTNSITSKHKIIQPKTKYKINMNKVKSFYTENSLINVRGGRINALKILSNSQKFSNYNLSRNTLIQNTTNLAAYLKFGTISIRECAEKFIHNKELYKQLIWREFYYHLGYGFIERFGKSMKPQYDKIKWKNDIDLFKHWCDGKTGYPIVDASMMQLNTTGFMHNRGRLIVASFLIKNLHIDWRLGEKYFAQNLVDYDVFVNQGNWQWVAGSGADSQPYFRVFNPSLQSHNYDKLALYIKKWLPQLSDIPPHDLHNWNTEYVKYDLHKIKYNKPIVDYIKSKEEGILMYKKIF